MTGRIGKVLVGLLVTFLFSSVLNLNPAIMSVSATSSLPPEWTNIYGGLGDDEIYSVIECSNGGFALAGYTDSFGAGDRDFWLVRTDSNGVMLWNKTYGGSGYDIAYSVVETNDQGFAIVGETDSFGSGNKDFWLVKTDLNGDIDWSQTYNKSFSDIPNSIVQTSDDGFAIAGTSQTYERGHYDDAWFVRTDLNGVELWNHTYGGAYNDQANSVIETSDGGFALYGSLGTPEFAASSNCWLVRTDSDGVELWSQTYGRDIFSERGWKVVETNEGGFALAGFSVFSGWDLSIITDLRFISANSSGAMMWSYYHPYSRIAFLFPSTIYTYFTNFCSVVESDGGSFILAGFSDPYDVENKDFWLAKFDSNGYVLYNQTYGGLNFDQGDSVIESVDGIFVLDSFSSNGDLDTYFAKLPPPEPGDLNLSSITLEFREENLKTSGWDYTITQYYTGIIVAEINMPADQDTSTTIYDLVPGLYTVSVKPKHGYGATITANGESSNGLQAIVYVNSNEVTFVEVTNRPLPIPLSEYPTFDLDYELPAKTIVPVQAAWSIDVDEDGKLDLVLDKPTAILVNLTEVAKLTNEATVSVIFDGTEYVSTFTNLVDNPFVSFYNLVPQTEGLMTLSGSIEYMVDAQVFNEELLPLGGLEVNVKNTSDLTLAYSYLYRETSQGAPKDYGKIDPDAYQEMVNASNVFINATYPVANVTADLNYFGIEGATPGNKQNPFKGILEDADNAKEYAFVFGDSAIGVAVVPDPTISGFENYFVYQLGEAYESLAGISFGPAMKGVVVMDGYWTVAAHEVAHTYRLNFFPAAEQYVIDPPDGSTASGVWAAEGLWASGLGFMGTAEFSYKTLGSRWVNDTSTYTSLFSAFLEDPADPEVVLVRGLILENGTIDYPSIWLKKEQGTPDILAEGNYSVVFLDEGLGVLDEVSFDASFYVHVDPGVSMGELDPNLYGVTYGPIKTPTAAFAFAAVLPDETAMVQIVNNTIPEQPVVLSVVEAEDIVNVEFSSEAYLTSAGYEPIDAFECVFTPNKKVDGYKLAATNPGTFRYNLEITNDFEAAMFFAEVDVPGDFVLKDIGFGPVQVDGVAVPYSFVDGVLRVEDVFIGQDESVVLSVCLDYGLKFQYTADQPYDESSQDSFFAGYAFRARVNSLQADSAVVTAVGKKVTAVGGFLTDVLGAPKGGLTVEVTDGSVVVGSAVSSVDGFYFVEVPAGTYDVRAYNSLEQPVGSMVPNVVVKKDRYVAVDFDNLSPADPVVEGFVKDDDGDGLAGVEVQLLNHKGKVLASTSTNLGGYFVFRFYQPGRYVVAVVAPEGYVDPESVSLKVKQFEVVYVNFNLE